MTHDKVCVAAKRFHDTQTANKFYVTTKVSHTIHPSVNVSEAPIKELEVDHLIEDFSEDEIILRTHLSRNAQAATV